MQVNPKDGVCRSCGGAIEVVDADDPTMTAECECGDTYQVEPDAFGDGCMQYYVPFLAEREGGSE